MRTARPSRVGLIIVLGTALGGMLLVGCTEKGVSTTTEGTLRQSTTTRFSASSRVNDAQGDATDERDRPAPWSSRNSFGDITGVVLSIDGATFGLSVETGANANPKQLDDLQYVLNVVRDRQNRYVLVLKQTDDKWVSQLFGPGNSTPTLLWSGTPSVFDNVVSQAVPLAEMPGLGSSFRWGFVSGWRPATIGNPAATGYQDYVPEPGGHEDPYWAEFPGAN